jgi:hypothetical protein
MQWIFTRIKSVLLCFVSMLRLKIDQAMRERRHDTFWRNLQIYVDAIRSPPAYISNNASSIGINGWLSMARIIEMLGWLQTSLAANVPEFVKKASARSRPAAVLIFSIATSRVFSYL